MGYQQKLRGLVVSTGLLGVTLLGLANPGWAQDYKQAPMLEEKVKSGALPAVNERLPEHPFVETMVDGVVASTAARCARPFSLMATSTI